MSVWRTKNDWRLQLWLCLSIYGQTSETNIWHSRIAIVSFSLQHSSCYNLYVYFGIICSKHFLRCLVLNATKKVHAITVGHKLQRETLYHTRWDVQLEHFSALSVPTSQQPLRLTWNTTLPRNVFRNFQGFPEQLWQKRSINVPRCSHDWYFQKGGDVATQYFFLTLFTFVYRHLIGELAGGSIQKFEKTVKLLLYNNQISYVSNMNSIFKSFRCSFCDRIFSKTGNVERPLITCSERVKHIYPKNV